MPRAIHRRRDLTTVPDDYTFVVELVRPTAFFVNLITYIAFAPVPRHAIDKHGKQKWVDA